jgi:hypothetical protein
MLIYYIYSYIKKDGTPYYIGKGKLDRAWKKHRNVTTPTNKCSIIMNNQLDITTISDLELMKLVYEQNQLLQNTQQNLQLLNQEWEKRIKTQTT